MSEYVRRILIDRAKEWRARELRVEWFELAYYPGQFFLALRAALGTSSLEAGKDQDRRKRGVACIVAGINAGIKRGGRISRAPKTNTPGGIRTPDLRIRSPLLYPTELQARCPLIIDLLVRLSINFHGSVLPVRQQMPDIRSQRLGRIDFVIGTRPRIRRNCVRARVKGSELRASGSWSLTPDASRPIIHRIWPVFAAKCLLMRFFFILSNQPEIAAYRKLCPAISSLIEACARLSGFWQP